MNDLLLHSVDAPSRVALGAINRGHVRPEPRGTGRHQSTAIKLGHTADVMETAWFPTTKFGYVDHSQRWRLVT